MTQKLIFNDYDENGVRTNCMGCRTTATTDNNICNNLRFAFKDQIKDISDQALLNAYDTFAMTDMFGDNDARFIEFLTNEGLL